MRRSLRYIAPPPIYHETVIINQPPLVIIDESVTSVDPIYYDEWGYPYEGYPQDENAYYQQYYDQAQYLDNFGYSYDDQGSLYINPHDDYDPLLSGYYTEDGYVAPPAYLVGPGLETESDYPISHEYYSGYGLKGRLHELLKSWLTPYNYHQSAYYWNRM
ncbi:MAG: hypothetical protein GY869_18945, partial [Planctomycetes bacterium]|nr:hypothetical protein [Planctomycetota bacterium]